MPDRVDTIVSDLARARRRGTLGVFGEQSHRYRLNPPMRERDVLAFEARRSVRLPDDYRQFITRAGNGGAGPYYGLFKLGEIDDGHGHAAWDDFTVGNVGATFPHTEAWNDLAGVPPPGLEQTDEEEFARQLQAFEERYFSPRLMDGAIPICHFGCAARFWLVVTGPEAGNLWFDDRASDGGIRPVRAAGGEPITFFGWYRAWLDEVVAKLTATQVAPRRWWPWRRT